MAFYAVVVFPVTAIVVQIMDGTSGVGAKRKPTIFTKSWMFELTLMISRLTSVGTSYAINVALRASTAIIALCVYPEIEDEINDSTRRMSW